MISGRCSEIDDVVALFFDGLELAVKICNGALLVDVLLSDSSFTSVHHQRDFSRGEKKESNLASCKVDLNESCRGLQQIDDVDQKTSAASCCHTNVGCKT